MLKTTEITTSDKPAKPKKSVTLGCRCDIGLANKIRAKARQKNVTVNDLIAAAIGRLDADLDRDYFALERHQIIKTKIPKLVESFADLADYRGLINLGNNLNQSVRFINAHIRSGTISAHHFFEHIEQMKKLRMMLEPLIEAARPRRKNE